MRYIKLVACLVATLFTAVAFTLAASAQSDATIQDATSHSSVGYVYLSSNPSGNNYEINAFAAAANGKLTPVSGSPLRVGYVGSMAVNSKYLFVRDTVYIYTFAVASDGAIKLDRKRVNVSSIRCEKIFLVQCHTQICESTERRT